MRVSHTVGRKPRIGHEEGAREPIHLYVQIRDAEDLAMLIIHPQFREVMKQWLVIKPSYVVRLSAAKWCEFWVQIQIFEDRMVLGRGWEYFCHRHQVVAGDILVMRISGLGMKVQIYNGKTSTAYPVRCHRHKCLGDFYLAL